MKRLIAKVLDFQQVGSLQRFQVVIPGYLNGGKRWFRRFTQRDEAQDFAESLTRDPQGTIAGLRDVNAGMRPAPFTRTDRDQAEHLFAYFRQTFGAAADWTLGIKAFDAYHQANFGGGRILVADAIAGYHEFRELNALAAVTRADDRVRLSPFVAKFGHLPLTSITTTDLLKYITDIPLTDDGDASSRIAARNKIGPFYTWAVGIKKYLTENPITAITKDSLGKMGINNEFYQVDQFERMLRIAQVEFPDTLFPWFIVSGFGGLRSKEAARQNKTADALRWSDLYFEAETPNIHIRNAVGKDGKERHIDADWATAPLQAWLALVKREGEFVCATQNQINSAKARFTELTGIELTENSFRNSFGTYGRAVTGSIALVSEQMGNGPEVAEKYYVQKLVAGRGRAFFALRPLQIVEQGEIAA